MRIILLPPSAPAVSVRDGGGASLAPRDGPVKGPLAAPRSTAQAEGAFNGSGRGPARSGARVLLFASALAALLAAGCRSRSSASAVVTEVHVTDAFDLSKAAMAGHVDDGIPADAPRLYAVIRVASASDDARATVDWIAMTEEGEVGLSAAAVRLKPGQLVSVLTVPPGGLRAGRYRVGVHLGSDELAERPFRVVAAAAGRRSDGG